MSSPFEGGAKWLRKHIPQTDLNWKNCEIVGLFNSSNLQVTISRASKLSDLNFLKVLCFSFPFAFAAKNIKNLPLALRAREKIWARLVGKSREDLKGKSGRLRNFCLPVSPLYKYFLFFSYYFLTGPDEQLCAAFTFIPHNIWKNILP